VHARHDSELPGTGPDGDRLLEDGVADDVTELLDQEPERASKAAVKRGKGCFAVLIALAILVGGGYYGWQRASSWVENFLSTPDYTDPAGVTNITVTVPEGASLTAIGIDLEKVDVIKSTKAFSKAIKDYDGTPTVQAGSYKMRTQIPAQTALTRLTTPEKYRIQNQFKVLEGLRLSEQVPALAKATEIPAKDYQAALKKPESLGLPDWAGNKPEGFFFPDTYEMTEEANATAVLKQMTGRFNQVSDDLSLPAKAETLGRKPYDVVIVASIIEAEVRRGEDRAKVARVIYNRMAKDMPLQMDSTVHYAVDKSDTVTTTDQDRASKSPYNTYQHKGLPPGPISAPGKAALEAAANPAEGNWLYFFTVNPDSGETKFAATLGEHERNRAQFEKWCSDNPGRC
jgi:UPF0755 protein